MVAGPEVAAVVLAAGSGARFGERKQFLPLIGSERLVDRVVATLRVTADWIVVVIPADVDWDGPPVDAAITGGATRLESVRAGLDCLPASISIVVIGDAAHPLADARTTKAAIDAVRRGADAAMPWLESVEVVKRRDADGILTTMGREGIGVAQTPAVFRRAMLDAAHAAAAEGWEDTELIEAIGGTVFAVPGDPANVHVVDPYSLDLVRRLAI